ncbi:MAG: hypothetical protein AB7G11_09295 [Phycisphaerales bacterium]
MGSLGTVRSGFTVVELLAVVGMIGVGGAMTSVAVRDAAGGAASAAQPEPEDRIEAIKQRLDAMRKQIDEIESELDGLKAKRPAPLTEALAKARASARQLKDATQIRGIGQALIIWANQNQGRYPLPSVIDKAGTTVAGPAEAKDTTANILSVLIWGGFISTEMCISPAEANGNIKAYEAFEFDNPKTAVQPANAMWDPAFSADFTGKKPGNVSYAHLQPFQERLKYWADTFVTTEAVVSNRGPEIDRIDRGADGTLTPKPKNENSLTYLIHGPRDTWEGNIGFNDGHVDYQTRLIGNPKEGWPAYVNKEDKQAPDVLFFDEADAKIPTANLYLGIFTKSGKSLKDWNAIWD